jgi:Holliday junction resolvasome RuvABC DNA-binding subunit
MNGKAIANLKKSTETLQALGFDAHQIERISNLLHTEVPYGVRVTSPLVEIGYQGKLYADGHLIE